MIVIVTDSFAAPRGDPPPMFMFHRPASLLAPRAVLLSIAFALMAVALPARAQFRVEISGVGATQLPIAIAEVPRRGQGHAVAVDLGHREGRPRAQRPVPRRRFTAGAAPLDEIGHAR